MIATRRRMLLSLGLGTLLAASGCSSDGAGALAYFLSPEPKEPPLLKRLASDEKDKIVKVVILPYLGPEVSTAEFNRADQQLADAFSRQLTELCADNGEKVKLVPNRKVQEYLARHPRWRAELDMITAGKDFHADYVVVVDIHKLSLFEPGSRQIYRCVAELSVNLVDVNQPDEPAEQRDLHLLYPSEAHTVAVDLDNTPTVFKEKFFHYIGKQLAWQFSPYRKRETYYVD